MICPNTHNQRARKFPGISPEPDSGNGRWSPNIAGSLPCAAVVQNLVPKGKQQDESLANAQPFQVGHRSEQPHIWSEQKQRTRSNPSVPSSSMSAIISKSLQQGTTYCRLILWASRRAWKKLALVSSKYHAFDPECLRPSAWGNAETELPCPGASGHALDLVDVNIPMASGFLPWRQKDIGTCSLHAPKARAPVLSPIQTLKPSTKNVVLPPKFWDDTLNMCCPKIAKPQPFHNLFLISPAGYLSDLRARSASAASRPALRASGRWGRHSWRRCRAAPGGSCAAAPAGDPPGAPGSAQSGGRPSKPPKGRRERRGGGGPNRGSPRMGF